MNSIVSIIIASYNKVNLVEQTLQSVINQTYSYWELIIVDDCSTDGTVDILNKYALEYPSIRLVLNKSNTGANTCRNVGLMKSKGEYVVFLDADDILHKNCIKDRVSGMKMSPEMDFSVHTMQVFKIQIGDSDFKWMPNVKEPLKAFLKHNLPWQTMQPIWKRGFLILLGGFDETFMRMQDVELHTRALLYPEVKYKLVNAEPDCFFRIDDQRKNFNPINFLSRWVDSAICYYEKFYNKIRIEDKKNLNGTIFQVYFEVLNNFRIGKITKNEFNELANKLFSCSNFKPSFFERFIFFIAKEYNLYFFRIPGFNRLLKVCICL